MVRTIRYTNEKVVAIVKKSCICVSVWRGLASHSLFIALRTLSSSLSRSFNQYHVCVLSSLSFILVALCPYINLMFFFIPSSFYFLFLFFLVFFGIAVEKNLFVGNFQTYFLSSSFLAFFFIITINMKLLTNTMITWKVYISHLKHKCREKKKEYFIIFIVVWHFSFAFFPPLLLLRLFPSWKMNYFRSLFYYFGGKKKRNCCCWTWRINVIKNWN